MKPSLPDLSRTTVRTADPFWPAQLAYFRITFGIIQQLLNVKHRSSLLSCWLLFGSAYSVITPFANLLLGIHIELFPLVELFGFGFYLR